MAQIFPRSSNDLAKATIVGVILLVVSVGAVVYYYFRSPYFTHQGIFSDQPVPFSHAHHVAGLGIDCRYCHTSVEKSAFAGIPSPKTCMTCHSQIWTNASMLEPIRSAYKTGEPIKWNRVHNLPDFVYFNHSIHIAKGVACITCHGPVNKMPLMYQQNTLSMKWCLQCHTHPERYVGHKEDVFKVDQTKATSAIGANWEHATMQMAHGEELVKAYHIHKQTDCSICHR